MRIGLVFVAFLVVFVHSPSIADDVTPLPVARHCFHSANVATVSEGLVFSGIDLATFQVAEITHFALIKPNLLLFLGRIKSGNYVLASVDTAKKTIIYIKNYTKEFEDRGDARPIDLGICGGSGTRDFPTFYSVLFRVENRGKIVEDWKSYLDLYLLTDEEELKLVHRELFEYVDMWTERQTQPSALFRYLSVASDKSTGTLKPAEKESSRVFVLDSRDDRAPALVFWKKVFQSGKVSDSEENDFVYDRQVLDLLKWNHKTAAFEPAGQEKLPPSIKLEQDVWELLYP